MTERPRTRRPGPAIVVWSSVALFAVLFALLTYQMASSQPQPPRPVLVRQVVKRRVVTTVVPTPGRSTVTSSGGRVTASIPSPGPVPVTTGAS
jgi:heme/copper-type cytochrome/quinol oxidase subunit 3